MQSAARQPAVVEHAGDFDPIIEAMTTLEFRHDPYPLYARMRREHPVYRSAKGIWYVTPYADVETALHDLRLSNDRDRMTRALGARQGAMERLSRLTRRLGRVMTNTDPPDHTCLRKLVNKAFSARRVQGLRPRIQAIVNELLDAAVAAGRTMDLIAALASPLPSTVICELLGIPRSDQGRVIAWSHQLEDPTSTGLTPEGVEVIIEELQDYLGDLIRIRRAEPGDDLVSALVEVEERGDRLSQDELLSACFVLFASGHETVMDLIGNGTLALLRHPDQLRRLHEDPTLIRSAIEELLRYDSPNQMVIRVVAEAVEIAGQTLEDGDLVYLVLGAANRDPDRFGDPDRLDLRRPDNRHLSFGNGVHFCLAAPLARLEGEVAIGTLVRRLPALRLDTGTVEWRPNPALRGPACLPVAY